MIEDENSALAANCLLEIDSSAYSALGESLVHLELQTFARSTRIEIDHSRKRMILCGSDLEHHTADPNLPETVYFPLIKAFQEDYAEFHVQLPDYDFCMEDSWTGYFISKYLREQNTQKPLVIIHLDDHTDMMSTLLIKVGNKVMDPGICKQFNPLSPIDWESAIRSGSIGIGSFLTAIYYIPQPVHIIHLKHFSDDDYKHSYIAPSTISHSLLPHTNFINIKKQSQKLTGDLGSYVSGSDAERLLNSMPRGNVVVHIDLDYFINDYNGNIGALPSKSISEFRENALFLMENFFEAILNAGVFIDRWIIATSPGFCSYQHWNWLLDKLSEQIKIANQSLVRSQNLNL